MDLSVLYAGRINGISDYGRMMIPATEAVRVEPEGTRYLGKRNAPKAADAGKAARRYGKTAAKGWPAWVERRRNGAGKAKGVGGRAKLVPAGRKKERLETRLETLNRSFRIRRKPRDRLS